MNALTLVLPYFRNPEMLAEQQRIWADYPAALRARLHVIIVDDASPKQKATVNDLTITGLASLRLYRCLHKARWNWLFARNLGVQEATTQWVLLTDIDHALPAETLAEILALEADPTAVYRLSRVDAPSPWPYALDACPVREAKKFHPNTWLMTRAMYDAIGGYDERLSGCYGTDGEFKDRVNATASAVVQLSRVRMVRYPREIVADASTVGFTRKNDPVNDDDLRARRTARNLIPGWRPLRVSFPYEQLA